MDDTHLNFNHPASCSIEDAVLYLLDFKYENLQPKWDGNEWVDHPDYLLDKIEEAEAALSEAKFHNVTEELIKQKQVEYDNAISRKKLAHEYQCAIVDDLSSATPILLLDVTSKAANPFITFVSLKQWANEVYGLNILDEIVPTALVSKLSKRKALTSQEKMPWWEVDPNDPPIRPKIDFKWYTPARYFARLYKTSPEQHTTNIYSYITEKLAEVGCTPYGRSNRRFDSGTIKRALTKVSY